MKNVEVNGRFYPVKRDLFTSCLHHEATFAKASDAPFPASGTEYAFDGHSLVSIGRVDVRVASVVPLLMDLHQQG